MGQNWMDRRKFLQSLAVAGVAMNGLAIEVDAEGGVPAAQAKEEAFAWVKTGQLDTAGHTLLTSFESGAQPGNWKVYEDLRNHDGAITLVSPDGRGLQLAKRVEATFPDANPPWLGLKLSDIGMAGPDLLADRLLRDGDPDPEQVKAAAPPMASEKPTDPNERPQWNTIVGTRECFDTMPVYPSGSTRTYHPVQYLPEIDQAAAAHRYEGLLGGWLPAVRKVFPAQDDPNGYDEVIVFADVQTTGRFVVQTWHRTARIRNGKMVRVQYGYSYPAFPPARLDPSAEEFYAALLQFTQYWQHQLRDAVEVALPDPSWVDMARHAFAKELIVRPGGVYPKYGAVDRDYYGPEYDGFQDIFTSALFTNLEWGRFAMARDVLDNYYSEFVDARGMINMRGPETAQFGLTLSLIARYFHYTGDRALLQKHRAKFEATAAILTAMHEESLRLPKEDTGYGLIHGWSESDSCLMPKPEIWWRPYFSNSAFAARGLRDLATAWKTLGWEQPAGVWLRHADQLASAVVASVRGSVRHELNPPYIGPLPGAQLTFRESMATEHPSPQGWPHRAYAELLQADILPTDLASVVIDCMRAYGATTLGIVANVEPAHADGRDILGFISYGYAQMLLRLDRIEEFLLFLYAHRYHDHSRGSWTAGEVAGITGSTALFCIPAQQTIPLLVRWMLVLEDSDVDRLYLAKGLPREWVTSGKEIRIEKAPTRWGRVSFHMIADAPNQVTAKVHFDSGAPKEVHCKLRLPRTKRLQSATVNGQPAQLAGTKRPSGQDTETVLEKDSVQFETGNQKEFVVVCTYA